MLSTVGGWLQNFRGDSRRRGKSNARRRPHGSLEPVDEVPEDFAPLFNRDQDEFDLSTITPMLSNRPPMTWPAYCEKFSEALKEDSTGYPRMYARYQCVQNLVQNEQIRVEAARTGPIFDASEKLSKAFFYICLHDGSWRTGMAS